jgi:3-hydroxyacyl-CoA dehydrogenase
MPDRRIESIAVVGAGVIGSSWAAYFAAHGHDVVVTDPAPGTRAIMEKTIAAQWEQLATLGLPPGATLASVRFEPSLERAVADVQFVQENGPERLEIKRAIFDQLDRYCAPDAILATSTSGLLVSDIQTACRHPQRVVLGHPFNPPHLIPLIEVVGGRLTSAETVARAMNFYRAIGKKPIEIKREVPGHVANRLQAALWREAFHLVESGIASVEDIDTAIEYGPGLRWALLGPFMNLDLSGGSAGIRHVLEHLGPPMENWWHDLGTPALSPGLNERVIAAATAELESLGGRAEVENLRDRRLLALLVLKAAKETAETPA